MDVGRNRRTNNHTAIADTLRGCRKLYYTQENKKNSMFCFENIRTILYFIFFLFLYCLLCFGRDAEAQCLALYALLRMALVSSPISNNIQRYIKLIKVTSIAVGPSILVAAIIKRQLE